MRVKVTINQRGSDLVYYRGTINGTSVNFTRVKGTIELYLTQSGDICDVILLDADNEFAISNIGSFAYDDYINDTEVVTG